MNGIIANTIKPNKQQQTAIDQIDNPIMLLAGPGTGKTFTIIHRIEQMIKQGISPSKILCLTFSDTAATEMKQRLINKLGIIASEVDVYTYHSFCNDIIKAYPNQFSISSSVKLISETQKVTLMKECIDEYNPKDFVSKRSDKYYFTKTFISLVEKIKSKRLSKNEYLNYIEINPNLLPRLKELKDEIYQREQAGKTQNKGRYQECEKIETNIKKAKELWEIYELYSQKMLNNNLIDFSDMINFVLDEFEQDETFLKKVSSKYSYFLVDEYQDTNDLQNNIIFHLLKGNEKDNIFVIGDDDQIIYGFQGANSDNIENFLKRFPQTKVICLEENNRSTQSILDLSYKVIQQDENRLENKKEFSKYKICKKLSAKNEKITKLDKPVNLYQFGDSVQEFNHIVTEISDLINSTKCPTGASGEKVLSNIAIIAKKRNELQTFAQLLKSKNIPFQLDEGKSIFSIRSSILIYFYLKALNNPLLFGDKLFGVMLSAPFKIELSDYNKILSEQRLLKKDTPKDFIYLMRNLKDWKNGNKIKEFLNTFDYLQEYASANNLRNSVVEIINRTGILEYFYKCDSNKIENLQGIKKIISEASDFETTNKTVNLSDFVKYLDDCLNNDIDITLDKSNLRQNAIQLTTFHGSKGREFDYVFLPNLITKNWEDFRMAGEYKLITEIENTDKDSELLRLLFVGITRAKHSLHLSFSTQCEGKQINLTKYLSNIPLKNFNFVQFEYNEEDFTTELIKTFSQEVFDNRKALNTELQERINKIELSPSRLNDYITCPRKFFYLKVLGIDVEEANWDSANYGSLIHKLLENAVHYAKKNNGIYPQISTINEDFDKNMESVRFMSKASQEKFERLGKDTINNYYPHFCQISPDKIWAIEYKFANLPIEKDFVTGKIDRIEQNSDGTFELYDYKTGKPVSEKQITLGGNKENYYNQLCFYKWAFEKATGKTVSKVGLIFVEDFTKSVNKNLTDKDNEYIENLIKNTYKQIKNMEFPLNESDHCKFCAYKQLCKLNVI